MCLQEVEAHRCVLAVRSDHFRAMFSSGMRESLEQRVVIPDMRLQVFRALLVYLYCDILPVSVCSCDHV